MPDIPEPRFDVDLRMRVFGMDAEGRPFSRDVDARNISDHGARLSGFEKQLTPGDIIGVHFSGRKARCTVMNVVDIGVVRRIEAGVRLVEGQACPWQKEMEIQRALINASLPGAKPATKEKRRFPRRRIPFPVEIQEEPSLGRRMSASTADIAGNGCYVETRMPLAVNKVLSITFWLNSQPVHTTAIVRTCDGGVGMGIEFTGLDETNQKQLQQYVETIAAEAVPFQPNKTQARGTS
jgi:PilZ domain